MGEWEKGMDTKTAQYTLNDSPPEALVIHCSDPRFQAALQKFLQEELRLTHYMPLVIPGSICAIGLQDLQPKYFKTLYQQLKILTNFHKVPRTIIINHDDCKGYESIKGFLLARRRTLGEQQRKDLLEAATMLKDFLPGTHVELYQARIAENKQISFDKIF